MTGAEPDPIEAALAFVGAINAADADTLAALMTDDFIFIDYLGNEFVGRESMRDGFRRYFEQYPGYHVEVEQALACGDSGALLVGRARRSHLGPELEESSTLAWLAEVAGGRVAVWRIFAPPEVIAGD
jgi:uncharacterized protein (TIGR02246 family)